ncbi:MAG: adenylate/guanylate cyclase domain-containing protein [Chloroflexota bacterium]
MPLDFDETNLGVFILWDIGPAKTRFEIGDEVLNGGIAAIYYGLRKFLSKEYGQFLPTTYLPSLYSTRWFRVAVMSADIHNFTPLSEMLRNVYSQRNVQESGTITMVLNDHCRTMAETIQTEGRGRIDRFVGPGVVAIFGEHEDHPVKASASAVYAALRMVERFHPLREKFLRQAFGQFYDSESNEAVDIDLGIGIDYGTVLFDYLGDDYHREYTILGDHVNFANLLKFEAGRFDVLTKALRPPVLISPTVERCIRPWLKQPERIRIQDVPRGMAYTAFGVSSANFDDVLYQKCLENPELWDDASIWGEDAPPPRRSS